MINMMRCRGESLNMLGFAPMLPVVEVELAQQQAQFIERLQDFLGSGV